MEPIKFKNKDDKEFIIEFDNKRYKKELVNGHMQWKCPHTVIDSTGKYIGHGDVSATCRAEHEHISDELMLDFLRHHVATMVKEDMKEGNTVESRGYNVHIWDCRK